MRLWTPLAAILASALLAAPCAASPELAKPDLEPAPSAEVAETTKPDKALVERLRAAGFTIEKDLSIVKAGAPGKLDKGLLKKAHIEFDEKGRLAYDNGNLVEEPLIVPVLEGLLPFASIRARDAAAVGKVLAAWGVPQSYNGDHLLNPDGSATYYGLMFHEAVKDHPATVKHLSGQRLSKSLDLFKGAFDHAFGARSAPDVGAAELKRAFGLLTWEKMKPGETALDLKPYADLGGAIEARRSSAEAVLAKESDPKSQVMLKKLVSDLNELEKSRYHRSFDLPEVPAPSKTESGAGVVTMGAGDKAPPLGELKAKPEPARLPPPQSMLGRLLKGLDWLSEKVDGKPMSADQQEAWVKAFPMGETVWRMGAQDLWREELTGKGIKVAVLDTGVGRHRDLPNVASRQDFTRERASSPSGSHGTHVAGTIAALAPDAEINSYKVLNESHFDGKFEQTSKEIGESLVAAVEKAVADGNQVVNMSLGGPGHASETLAKTIDRLAREKGVIFVISAGNSAGSRGIGAPSVSEEAFTIGSLDANGRVSTYSSYGEVWDPVKVGYSIKKVFMTPGQDINSAEMDRPWDKDDYQKMSGTSMAAPHATGAFALLLQAGRINGLADPVALSRAVRGAVEDTSKTMPRNELPSDLPPEQDFVIVDPRAAREALRPKRVASK